MARVVLALLSRKGAPIISWQSLSSCSRWLPLHTWLARNNRRHPAPPLAHTWPARRRLSLGGIRSLLSKDCTAPSQRTRSVRTHTFFWGLTEFQSGETAESIPHYKAALKLDPRSYSGHYDLALAYLKQNKSRKRGPSLSMPSLWIQASRRCLRPRDCPVEDGKPAAALPHLLHAHALTPGPSGRLFNINPRRTRGRTARASAPGSPRAKEQTEFRFSMECSPRATLPQACSARGPRRITFTRQI